MTEGYTDPVEVENKTKLSKLEELFPQKFDYAMTLIRDGVTREEFLQGLDILNESVENMPIAEGMYDTVHFRTQNEGTLDAKMFENGRITFSGSWSV